MIRLNKLPKIIIFLLPFLTGLSTKAEERDSLSSRPVIGFYNIEIGSKNVIATYLSPLHYTGTNLGISGLWTKAMPFNPQKSIMTFRGGLDFANLYNPVKTARMIGIDAYFTWGMAWRSFPVEKLQLTLGGDLGISGGAYYLMRNSNNPVQVIAQTNIAITAGLSYPLKIGKLNMLVSDNIRVPSIGLFFDPQYGETYYEIYLGNHKGLIHAGWWGNNFCIDNLLSLNLDFGRTALSICYRFRLNSQWDNHLDTKIMTNSFVIGIVPGGLGLKKQTKSLPENKIYSIY